MAKILLKNEKEIRKYLMGSTYKTSGDINAPLIYALDYVMMQIKKRNADLIQRIVYDSYSPEEYERTKEFLESWEYNIESGKAGGTKATGQFNQDYELMHVNNAMAQHGSPFENAPDWYLDAREYLADIIYNNGSGKVFGHGPWTRKRDVWTPLMKTVESKIYKWYADGLKQAGLNIK